MPPLVRHLVHPAETPRAPGERIRMAGPEATAEPPRRPHWLPAVLRGCAAGAFLVVVFETVRIVCLGNVHAVVPGRVYRCSQPSPAGLERLIKAYGVRTVINLRGGCNPFP